MTEKIEKRVGWWYDGNLYDSEDEAKIVAIWDYVTPHVYPGNQVEPDHDSKEFRMALSEWQKALELYGPVHFGGEG